MHSQHHRFQIWSSHQHPYKHNLAEFSFTNSAFGDDVTNAEEALNWLIKVLYPTTKAPVATPGDLPAAGNTLNDYRVVNDDGDGNFAAYRWEQREGDVAAKWYKVADYDWSSDAILSAFQDKTMSLVVYKQGMDDYDDSGAALTGDDAGQHIWGGVSASTHLTLHANSGDGTGAQTGYVQFADDVRPHADSTYDLGTNSYRFANGYFDSITSGTLTATSGSITDSSGAISFGDEDLTTTGDITAASFVTGTLTIDDGSIVDTDGLIDFGATDLTTTGDITGGLLDIDNLRLDGNTISSTNTDGDIVLSPDGTGVVDIPADVDITGDADIVGSLDVDNINLNGNTVSITNADGDLVLQANGTGVVDVNSTMETGDIDTTGDVDITGSLSVDNIDINGNTISSTDTNGNIVLDPNGSGLISAGAAIHPDTDDAYDLGDADSRFQDIFMSGSVQDGTNAITIATLLSLRDILSGINTGDAIFWDGAKFVASNPDTEIDHGELLGESLDDDDHTQYMLLAGRSGGQDLIGGADASDDLTLESTSNGTKGFVISKDDFLPGSDGDKDLGASGAQWGDLYMTGELIGSRIQNFADSTARTAATGTEGRLGWQVDTEELYIGTGAAWKNVSTDSYYNEDASNWTGSVATVTYDVSASTDNAKRMVWQFKNNTNDYSIMAPTIDHPTDTQVRVTFGMNLPAGTYTLVGR